MSRHAFATRPNISLEFGPRPLFGWTKKLDFWHPALPKVQSVGAVGVFTMTTESVTPSWPFGTWRKVADFATVALLFSLLLPAAVQAQEPCKVNVNSASPAQLGLLIQTGPALAAKIKAARKDPKTGAAVVLDAAKLDAVSGIGVKWLEYNTPHVAYDGSTTCEAKLRKPAGCFGDEMVVKGKCVPLDDLKPEAGKDGAQ